MSIGEYGNFVTTSSGNPPLSAFGGISGISDVGTGTIRTSNTTSAPLTGSGTWVAPNSGGWGAPALPYYGDPINTDPSIQWRKLNPWVTEPEIMKPYIYTPQIFLPQTPTDEVGISESTRNLMEQQAIQQIEELRTKLKLAENELEKIEKARKEAEKQIEESSNPKERRIDLDL